jgi:hypothetical protein
LANEASVPHTGSGRKADDVRGGRGCIAEATLEQEAHRLQIGIRVVLIA